MFNFIELAIFGTPFDSTSKAHFIEPSKSRQFQNETLKMIPKVLPEFAALSLNEINVMVDSSCKNHQFFGRKSFLGTHPASLYKPMYDAYIEHLKLMLKRFPSTPAGTKMKLKYLQFFDAHYHSEFEEYRTSNPARYQSLWLSRDLISFAKKQLDILIGPESDNEYDLFEVAKSQFPDPIYRHLVAVASYVTQDLEIEEKNVYATYVFLIFHCLYTKTDINDALKAAWLVAYNTGLSEAFPLALYPFQEQVFSANLPYLNLSGLLKFYEIHMHRHDSNYSIFEVEVLFGNAITTSIDAIHGYDLDKPQTYIELAKVLLLPESFNPRDVFFNEVWDMLNVFKQSLKTDIELSSLDMFTASPLDYLMLHKDIHEQLISKAQKALANFDDAAKSTNDDLQQIQEKAKLLSVDALDNIDKLLELKTQKTTLQQQLDDIQQSFRQQFDALAKKHNAIIDDFNQRHRVQDQEQEQDHKIEELTALIHDANLEIKQLNDDKKRLNELLNKPANTSYSPAQKTDCMPVVLSFLEEKNPFVTIVKTASQRDWVVLSSKLIKSLEEIKTFSRPLEFAKAFDILTSKDFVEAVSQQGSEAAFSFFTKTQMAFKESDTTMSNAKFKNERYFQFHIDGKTTKLLCEPHLRIGNNNTAQEQLRVHFLIQNGIIHIGYIGRHLPTGAI